MKFKLKKYLNFIKTFTDYVNIWFLLFKTFVVVK